MTIYLSEMHVLRRSVLHLRPLHYLLIHHLLARLTELLRTLWLKNNKIFIIVQS